MKCLITIILTIVIIISLTACGACDSEETNEIANSKEAVAKKDDQKKENFVIKEEILKTETGILFTIKTDTEVSLEFVVTSGKTYKIDLAEKEKQPDGTFKIKLDDEESLGLTANELKTVEAKVNELANIDITEEDNSKESNFDKDINTDKSAKTKKSQATTQEQVNTVKELNPKETLKNTTAYVTPTTKATIAQTRQTTASVVSTTESTATPTTRAITPTTKATNTYVAPTTRETQEPTTTKTTPSTTAHVHNWQPVYKTTTVVVKEAWTETIEEPVMEEIPVTVFHADGYVARTYYEVMEHGDYLLALGMSDSCYSDWLYEQTGTIINTIEHPAITEQQQVIDYYKCSCGENKAP